jgi:hypothetical protein
MRAIENADLRLDDVPLADAPWDTIQEFALSFNAYDYHGSFERCADIAIRRDPQNLTELRTCLFMQQRASRHCDEDPSAEMLSSIGSLLDAIREKASTG